MGKLLPVFERLLFWMVWILVVFIPLYPKLPLIGVSGSFVSIRMEDFVIAAAFLLWGVYLLLSGGVVRFLQNKINQAILLFFFIGALSTFAGIFLTHTVVASVGLLHWLRRIEMVMLLPVAYTAISSKKQLQMILATISGVLLIVLFYGLGQRYLGFPIISTTTADLSTGEIGTFNAWTRINSTFGGQYDLAIFLVMALSFITPLFFFYRKITLKIWLAFLGALSIVVLIMTASRLSFAAAVAGILFALIIIGQKKYVGLAIVAMILILAYPSQLRDRMVSTLTVSVLDMGTRYNSQSVSESARSSFNIPTLYTATTSATPTPTALASGAAQPAATSAAVSAKKTTDVVPGEPTNLTARGVYRSFAIRLDQEWPRAIRALEKDPLIGTGYSSIGLAADNDYLRSLGEVGILGTLAFALLIFGITKATWKNFRSSDRLLRYFSAGMITVIMTLLLNALFIDVFEASKVASMFWLIAGASLAIEKITNNK